MFDNDQELVEELLATDVTFRTLHLEALEIKYNVHKAEIGPLHLLWCPSSPV